MPGSDHSAAWTGLWKRAVASKTARAVPGAVSTVSSSPPATPSAMIHSSDERVYVGSDDVSCIGGQLDVGREELGVVERPAALAGDEEVEPALQALGSRALPARDGFERLRGTAALIRAQRKADFRALRAFSLLTEPFRGHLDDVPDVVQGVPAIACRDRADRHPVVDR